MSNLIIGSVLGNPNAEIKIVFGSNVKASRVVDYVKRNAHMREVCGLISNVEASELVRETEEKLKELNLSPR
jgi:hypothetical protein